MARETRGPLAIQGCVTGRPKEQRLLWAQTRPSLQQSWKRRRKTTFPLGKSAFQDIPGAFWGVNLWWPRVSGALLGQNQKGRQNGSFLLGFLAEARFPSVSPRRRASKKSKEVYHEPEYDDSEPLLLGSITVPLFALRRRRQICLQLPLKQESETARQMYAPHFRGSERDLSRFLGL